MKKKLIEGNIVKITWVDQSSYTGPHIAIGAIQEVTGFSIGHFLEENKNWLSIGMEKMNFGKAQEISYRHILTFPKACIKKIEVLQK